MRADARRNRERIVETARRHFFAHGRDVPLDDIARAAGVGPGTLYRHFPTRDALVDACMGAWEEDVAQAVETALASGTDPRTVLPRWVGDYVRVISYFPGSAESLTAAIGDEASIYAPKCLSMVQAWATVLSHLGAEDGQPERLDPVTAARAGGAMAAIIDAARLDEAAARPLLSLLVRGLLESGSWSAGDAHP